MPNAVTCSNILPNQRSALQLYNFEQGCFRVVNSSWHLLNFATYCVKPSPEHVFQGYKLKCCVYTKTYSSRPFLTKTLLLQILLRTMLLAGKVNLGTKCFAVGTCNRLC